MQCLLMVSVILYGRFFLLLTWELSLPYLVLLRCPKRSEINIFQTFLSRSCIARCKSMHADCVIYPFTNIMLNLLPYYILYSSLFYLLNFAHNTYLREIGKVAGINNRRKSLKKVYGHEQLLIVSQGVSYTVRVRHLPIMSFYDLSQ